MVATNATKLVRMLMPQIKAALPEHLAAARIARTMLSMIRLTPALMKCTMESLAGAIIQAALLGWEPGPGMAQCVILPYGDEATLIPMFGGLIDLATRSGRVLDIRANVVLKGDDWSVTQGSNQQINHTPNYERKTEPTFDNVVLAYAIATMANGVQKLEIVELWKLIKIRSKSSSYNAKYNAKSPWNDWPVAMCRKTGIKQIAKYLPKSSELQTALQLVHLVDMGKKQDLDRLLTPTAGIPDGEKDETDPFSDAWDASFEDVKGDAEGKDDKDK